MKAERHCACLAVVLVIAFAWLFGSAQAQQGGAPARELESAAAMQLFRDDCKLIDQLSAADSAAIKAKPQGFVLEVQRGLRSVYTPDDFRRLNVVNPQRFLNDDKFGTQTQRALQAFCQDFPVVTEARATERWNALFASARHFYVLGNWSTGASQPGRDWRAQITAAAAVAAFGNTGASPSTSPGVLRLRLAGAATVVAQLLGDGPALQVQAAEAGVCTPAAGLTADILGRYAGVLAQLLEGRAQPAAGKSYDGADAAAFCRKYRVAGSADTARADTLAALQHYLALHRVDPQALATIASAAFGAWVTEKGTDPLPYHRLLRLAGSVPVVLALLQEFRDAGGGDAPPEPSPNGPSPAALPPSCSLTEGARYFELTAADLKALSARPKLTATLNKGLRSSPPAESVAAALEAVDKLAPGLDACSRDVAKRALEGAAKDQTVYVLIDDGFASGPLFALPPAARQALQALAKLPPPATEAALVQQIALILSDAVQQKADADAQRYAPLVAAQAVPASSGAAAASSGNAADGSASAGPASNGTASSTPASGSSDSAPAAAPSATATVAQPMVLSPNAAAVFNAEGIPKPVASAVAGLDKRTFASADDLTRQATQAIASELAKAGQAQADKFMAALKAQIKPQTKTQIAFDDATMTALLKMPALQPVGPGVPGWVEPLQGVTFAGHSLFASAAVDPLNQAEGRPESLAQDLPNLVQTALKRPANGADPLQLNVPDDCGCVPWDKKADRDVYGFYPYWAASGEAPPAVDLSLYSRVAFFAASTGKVAGGYGIVDWAGWQASDTPEGDGIAAFIEDVHRHNGRADLAVYLDQWQTWAGKEADVAQMARDVAARAPQPPGFWSAAWRMVRSWGEVNGFLEAPLDGITLYFPDLADALTGKNPPETPVSAGSKILSVVKAFRAELPDSVAVNIAFDMPIAGTEDSDVPSVVRDIRKRVTLLYMALVPDVQADGMEGVPFDLVLVLLNRPTTESKKLLVRGIQDGFAGNIRRDMLRKTVAVLAASGHEPIYSLEPELQEAERVLRPKEMPFSQLDDDLSFARDNFRGVGFWPLPTAADAGYESVAALLRDRFWVGDGSGAEAGAQAAGWSLAQAVPAIGVVAGQVEALVAGLAEFVCTNRIAARFLAAALFGLLLLLALLSYFRCVICMRLAHKSYVLPALGLAFAVLWFLLAVFDPFFAPFAILWLLVLLPLLILFNLAFGYMFRMRRADDP